MYRVSFASAIHNNAWQHFLIRNCSFLFTELMFSTVSIFTWTHPLLQIFETLLVQNFNKLWLKILVTIPCPTGDWAVRLQVVQHVHFLLRSLSIKSNITCQQGFCFKLPKKKTQKTRYCKNVCINGPYITSQIPTRGKLKQKADNLVYMYQ